MMTFGQCLPEEIAFLCKKGVNDMSEKIFWFVLFILTAISPLLGILFTAVVLLLGF